MGAVCICDAQGCTHYAPGGPDFAIRLIPPSADGSVSDLDGSVHNVHLVKQ